MEQNTAPAEAPALDPVAAAAFPAIDIEAAKAAQLPIGTVEAILAKAPADLTEEVVQVPEWGCSVRIRSQTAGAAARVKQAGMVLDESSEQGFRIDVAVMERHQFFEGVIEPRFTLEQAEELQETSGPGFQRVIQALDRLSGTRRDGEVRRAAERDFRSPTGE